METFPNQYNEPEQLPPFLASTIEKKYDPAERKTIEDAFHAVLYRHLSEEFDEDLREADYSEEEIRDFNLEMSKLKEETVLGIFALPWEIRTRRLKAVKKKIGAEGTMHDAVGILADDAEEKGYTLGYHISPVDIPPDQGNPQNGEDRPAWKISGYELDDRDDRPMAYYSLDYTNLFRKKRGQYLYVIRAATSDDTAHKRDTRNNWGRAASLSIVGKFPISSIDEEVDKVTKEMKNRHASLHGGSVSALPDGEEQKEQG